MIRLAASFQISLQRKAWIAAWLLAVSAAGVVRADTTSVIVNADAPVPPPVTESLAAYQSGLLRLDQVVAKCQQKIVPANCDSASVGPDVQLILPGGTRQVRFAWLRGLLAVAAREEAAKVKKTQQTKAQNAKHPQAPNQGEDASAASDGDKDSNDSDDKRNDRPIILAEKVEFPPMTVEDRLAAARERLSAELQWAAASGNSSNSNPATDATQQRQILAHILSAKEYKETVVNPSLKDRLLEKIARWINQGINKLINAGSQSKWIGTTAEIGFGLVICIALVWFLIRLERQGRFTASMIRPGPGSGAASARDWQLWLQDAHDAATRRAWRDAIHLLYWASISRLESSGLWPADRARTPREYLSLLSPESQHRPDLGALTRSFEHTWYAGREARESDFQAAEQLAARLGARSGSYTNREVARR